MTRTDDDTWEITESVGSTALGVAAGRAAETTSDSPLIHDPFAQLFLDAVGGSYPNLQAHEDDLPVELLEADPRLGERLAVMRNYIACRTAFFDDFFRAASADGIRQSVILAAGLDARAWRLDWPADGVVYELDQTKVLDFKASTLEAHAATPRVAYVGVAVDLRHDWPAALAAAGFDPARPTAWSAEGLLPYLPADAQRLLFERIAAASAPGSRVAVEAYTNDFYSAESQATRRDQSARYRLLADKLGGGTHVADTEALFYAEDRMPVGEWFGAHDWTIDEVSAPELMSRHGRRPSADVDDSVLQTVFVEARRPR